jgi:large subunit ribosomal protein L10
MPSILVVQQQIQMGKSLAQKKEIVSNVHERISSAQLMFSLKLEKVTMPEINNLRNSLPAGTNAIVIKNRLLKRASSGTPWKATESLGKGSNLWVVIDDDVKGSIKAFKDWQKATKKEDGIIGGVVEGTVSEYIVDALRFSLYLNRIYHTPTRTVRAYINRFSAGCAGVRQQGDRGHWQPSDQARALRSGPPLSHLPLLPLSPSSLSPLRQTIFMMHFDAMHPCAKSAATSKQGAHLPLESPCL